MKSLHEVNPERLKWVQRSNREDELVSGDDAVAALHWAKNWGSLAVAESDDGKWTFKRVGFIHTKITIRKFGEDLDFYIADVGVSGETTLMLPGQGAFRWTPNIWRGTWTLRNNDGHEVMSIQLSGVAKVIGNLTIKDSTVPVSTLSLLALLGWYLIMNVLTDDVTASTTAVIVATMP